MSRRISARAGLGLGALMAVPAAAPAEDFKVTNLNEDGAGSLRDAIEQANADAAADRVLFKSKLSGEIDLSGPDVYDGLLVAGGDLDIVGPGARQLTVRGDGGPAFRISGAPYAGNPAIDVTISGLEVTGASPAGFSDGGGVASGGDVDLRLSRVTIIGNGATFLGGGVASFGSSSGLVVESSTISGNSAGTDGGGVSVVAGDAVIHNSTISGNTAENEGGGVYVVGAGATFEARHSTVVRNTAGTSGGGLYEYNVPSSGLTGTIVADNDSPGFLDLDEGPWEGSFNLVENPATTVSGSGNLLEVDPLLKPLANNGGPTDTHAFKKSPAKNKGPSDAPGKDQRGAPRKGKADIGAYEFTKCKGVVVNRVGTSGKDKLKGTKRKDGMLGLGGNDKLRGKKGKDGLCGGRGKDKLIGGPGKDKFNGGPGKDKEKQ